MLAHVGLSWAQVGPKLAPSWPPVCACWPKLAQVTASWCQVGPNMAPSWLMLAPSWPHHGPSSKVSARLANASTNALPLRPGFSKMSTKALPSTKVLPRAFRRSIVCQGVHEGSASKAWVFQDVHEGFASGVPTFEALGFSRCPRRLCLRRSDVRLFATVSTKALPLRLGFSKMSTKALPQAFRRSIVRSGCSILLLSILKVVSLWCFLHLALSC